MNSSLLAHLNPPGIPKCVNSATHQQQLRSFSKSAPKKSQRRVILLFFWTAVLCKAQGGDGGAPVAGLPLCDKPFYESGSGCSNETDGLA